jgi:hypothetical protein
MNFQSTILNQRRRCGIFVENLPDRIFQAPSGAASAGTELTQRRKDAKETMESSIKRFALWRFCVLALNFYAAPTELFHFADGGLQ